MRPLSRSFEQKFTLYLHFQTPFFVGQNPNPPHQVYPAHSVSLAQGAVQKMGAGMGNLLDRYQEVAEAAWIAYDQDHQKKTDNSGPNWKGWWWEWVNFMWIWILKCICFKKKHVSWFWICGWTSDKSFASPKPEKHLFVFFYIQVYLTSVRILVFGSLLIYFMFLVWESFFNGVVLPAERFFFRIRWVGFMGFVPRYWGTQEAAQLSLGAQGQHPRLRTSFLV